VRGDGEAPPDGGSPDGGSPDGSSPDGGGGLKDNTLPLKHWYWQGTRAADRASLAAALAKAGYTPPAGTYLLAAEVVGGLGQPAFRYYSLGEAAFTFSSGKYWPASTVKLTAAVGALWTLKGYGLSGAATVTFTDADGAYAGTVTSLYQQAITVSSNVAYNRLVEIAGFDPLNDTYLVPDQGLPQLVIQRRYTHPTPTADLRTSPPIAYTEGAKKGTIPKRVGKGVHPSCPNEGNCTTLFELLDVLRRVNLHGQLPAAERFPLTTQDVNKLRAAMLKAPTFLEPGASQALKNKVEIYNKSGQVYGDDRLDHGLIVCPSTGERYLIAWSMPFQTTTEAQGSELTRRVLLALKGGAATAPPLQLEAGVKIAIQLTDLGPGAAASTRRYAIAVDAPGADALELWIDRYTLPAPAKSGAHFKLTHDFSGLGERLLVVRARAKGKLIGYRAARVKL
jgi:hypothetical protein